MIKIYNQRWQGNVFELYRRKWFFFYEDLKIWISNKENAIKEAKLIARKNEKIYLCIINLENGKIMKYSERIK